MIGFGKVIRSIRKEKRIKQKYLAKKLGVTASYLSQVEKDRRKPSLDLIVKLSDRLNTPVISIVCKAVDSDFNTEDENVEFVVRQVINFLK